MNDCNSKLAVNNNERTINTVDWWDGCFAEADTSTVLKSEPDEWPLYADSGTHAKEHTHAWEKEGSHTHAQTCVKQTAL